MNTLDFSLLETMRWDNGIALLDWHLARLVQAAVYFDFPYDEGRICDGLAQAEATFEARQAYRVRLTLDSNGEVQLTTAPIDPSVNRYQTTAVYPGTVDPSGPFWRHKTTRRLHYAKPLYWARTHGFDEALLVSTEGMLVEGTRTNLWIQRDGQLLTPPMSKGGLPGVYRSHILMTHPEADEAVLGVEDLRTAEAVYVSNAVHGLQEVTVVLEVVEVQAA